MKNITDAVTGNTKQTDGTSDSEKDLKQTETASAFNGKV